MTRDATAARGHDRRWLVLAALGLAVFAAITVWVVHVNGPTPLDAAVLSVAVSVRTATLTTVAVAVTTLGSFPVVAVVAAATAVVLWWRTGRLLLALTLLIAVVETAAVVYMIKEVVGRDRPPVELLIGTPSTDGSFPSGHTTNGSLVYLLAAWFVGSMLGRTWLRRLLVATAIAVALSIGLTRVYLGYHWATDVLGGWTLAATVCCAAGFAIRQLDRQVPEEPPRSVEQGRQPRPPSTLRPSPSMADETTAMTTWRRP